MASFLTCLFDAWKEADVRYLILRNYEELPEFTGNDIDVLLDPAQREIAERLLIQSASEQGWVLHNIGDFACRALWLFNCETLEQVHIDLMYGINWHTLVFADHSRMLSQRQPFKNFYIPSPGDEAAVNLLTRLLYGGYVKDKYREGIRCSASGDGKEMATALNPWVCKELAEKMIAFATQGEWDKIEARCRQIRKSVIKVNVKRPFGVLVSVMSDVLRLVRRTLHSPGVSIVFFGPDGCGKTSVANGLKEALDKTFATDKGLHCHWKPFPQQDGKPPTEDPHALSPRNALLSLVYFIYHYLPFLWGWWLHVKPILFKSGMVIIDRYYYDFFVDLRRYRLNLPRWIIRLGFVFVKKPDLVFCLDADPEILQARKKEVSFEECSRQHEAYRELASNLQNGHVMDAAQPLEDVVIDVQGIVLEYMAERTAKRFGSHRGTECTKSS
ncbi:hypothetical protein P4B35_15485 [Pontiellaceae bacterium B12227]|nr:hypothetical protein [Pontiellaceae bacterium B12227]